MKTLDEPIKTGGHPATILYSDKDAKDQAGNVEPNIIFIGRVESKGEIVDRVPPSRITDGQEHFTLPAAADQLKGFYHPQASQIIRAMPKSYKRFEKKGAK